MIKTNNSPLVTIGVPVYNGEKFIIEALESIQKQTFINFECHIVNNASTDKSEALVSEFVKKDSRFKLHSYSKFVDIGENWNRTVEYISDNTKYFQIVAADDIIFPDYLESSVQLMEKYPGAGIATAFRMVGNSPGGFGLDYSKGNYWNGKEILLKQLKTEINVVGSVTQNLYRVECLKKLNFYPEIYISEDLHFDTRLAFEVLLIADLAFSFKITSYTRIHSGTVTSTIVKKLYTQIQGRENRLHRFKQYFPELQKNYIKIRRIYAYMLFINMLTLNRKCIRWHRSKLKRKIRFQEYVTGIALENKFSRFIYLLINRYAIRSASKPMSGSI
jgi:glycosyltransferase involved in cell wall biosynthesis